MQKSWILAMGFSTAMWLVTGFHVIFGIGGLKASLPIGGSYVLGALMLYFHCTCDEDKPSNPS